MAVGLPAKTSYVDGDVFSASDINDTNGTLNLVGQTQNFYAGKNKIINGDFGIWQRGTSFTPTDGSFTADRWKNFFNGSGSTRSYTQQTFTPGTAPVAGYEGTFFLRLNQSVAGSGGSYNQLAQPIENVRTFAGQTVTLSFWAKAAATTVLPNVFLGQNFGSGGSADVDTTVATSVSITTSWTRYTYTVAIPSVAGKTIGSSSYLNLRFHLPLNSTYTFDFWGVQLESGSTATAFQTASGSIQGELALCQRYYFRYGNGTVNSRLPFWSYANNSTSIHFVCKFPQTMRVSPTSVEYSAIAATDGGVYAATAFNLSDQNPDSGLFIMTISSGATANRPYLLIQNNNTAGYVGVSAEL